MGKHALPRSGAPARRRSGIALGLVLAAGLTASTVGAALALDTGLDDADPAAAAVGDRGRIVSRGLDRDETVAPVTYTIAKGATADLTPQAKRARRIAEQIARLPKGFERVDLTTTTTFNVSSFNVLGASHTVNGARGKASGVTRIRWAAGLLRGNGVTVAGLQEFQLPQAAAFRGVAGDYAQFPGAAGGNMGVQNSIVWDTGVWEMLDGGTSPIPYFKGPVPMPHVLLRHLGTGQRVWFMNYHNPADVRGPAAGKRRTATAMEASLANRLMADGTPVIMTGDFNDREPFFCQVSRAAPLHSSNGGHSSGGACVMPRPADVDWILGSPKVEFSNHVTDRSPLVSRTSDHPMIRASVTIGGAPDLTECRRIKGAGWFCPTETSTTGEEQD